MHIALVLFVFYVQTSAADYRAPDIVGTFGFDSVAECEAMAPKLVARLKAHDPDINGISHECRDVPESAGI